MDSLLQFEGISERLSDVSGYPDPNNNGYEPVPTSKGDKYSLRPRSLRRLTEPPPKPTETKPPKPSKSKQKPAPLSKYRRKTANARERNRMREINQAFETLRNVIPHVTPIGAQPPSGNEKLTKITTLRLAMKYISTLSAALTGTTDGRRCFGGQESSSSSSSLSDDYGDLDCLLLESDGESLPLSDNSLLASPDFPEPSLSPVDFGDPSLPSLLHTDFAESALEDDFSEFLLT